MGKYSEILMDHFSSPRNVGRMDSPDRVGIAGTPGQGPFMVLCLRVRDNVVVEAKYQTHGCGATIAAGSLLTELVLDRTIEDCRSVTAEQLTEALGGVPPDKLHCPFLAVTALQNALQG
jgi:NifU-like protein involved in Fe-S cluster formation